MSIADLDGDGRTDIAVANSASNTMSVFRNQSVLQTTGHTGAAIVGAGSEIQLFSIGLTSFGTFTLNGIDLTISDLDAPTGLVSNDLDLVLYRSSDETFDSGDTQIGLQGTIDIGSTTTISPTATETPTGHTFYIITARMNTVVGEEGHAFKVGFDLNGVTTSAGTAGAAFPASESNTVTFEVVADHWAFTSQPTNTTHLKLFSPQPFLEARDQHGNRDKDFNGTVTLSVSPSSTLSKTDFTAIEGNVFIDSLTVSGAGDGHTLTATGLGLDRHQRQLRRGQGGCHGHPQQSGCQIRWKSEGGRCERPIRQAWQWSSATMHSAYRWPVRRSIPGHTGSLPP